MFVITKAVAADVEAICNIGAQTFTDAYSAYNTKEDLSEYIAYYFSKEKIADELRMDNTGYYLCREKGEIIGYLKLNFDISCEAFAGSKVTELQRIYVLKEYYRKKGGSILMQYAVALCENLQYEFIWLGVWKENKRALKFYDSCGFEIIGERNFKLGSKVYDDFYLRKRL